MREDLYEEAFARMKKAAGVSGTAICNLTKLKSISSFKNCTSCLDYYQCYLSKVNEVICIVHLGLDDRQGITGYGVSSPGYKISKIFALKSTYPKEIIEF